ncbi:hypothetical protein HC928_18090, partial [bacterium]|nr:hypothetical protein [bacterium]
QQGRLSRQRFGVVLRNLMTRFGRQAYEQGLQDGGVDPRDATDEDASAVRDLVLSQSVYIRNFIERVWSRDRESFPLNTEARASMWFNKSISPFYDAGLMSADRNGMYEWILGPTEEHCPDCSRLNGQRHRLKTWNQSGWLPQADKLACKGFKCKCNLKKPTNVHAGG